MSTHYLEALGHPVAGVTIEHHAGVQLPIRVEHRKGHIVGMGEHVVSGITHEPETILRRPLVDPEPEVVVESKPPEPDELHRVLYENVSVIRQVTEADGSRHYRLFEWSQGDVTQRPVRL